MAWVSADRRVGTFGILGTDVGRPMSLTASLRTLRGSARTSCISAWIDPDMVRS